ncbi:hypothetical protein A2U01_0086598, partial [Trifolium medium]|nr:hypothetical protein [Trifolium medium]
HEVKGLVLSHLLSARQEKEAADAYTKAECVEKTVSDIEGRHATKKEKLSGEVEKLKKAREDDADAAKKECDAAIAKVKEEHAGE